MIKSKLIAVVGSNAVGKSALAVELAKKFGGEVLSADSRQVYRGLNIGSGKIRKKEMRGIPHHLLDVASPKRIFTVAQYQKLARQKIKEVISRGRLPILCGGSGFYVQTIVDNLTFPSVKPILEFRKKLKEKSTEKLAEILEKLDRRRAKTIDRKNRRRLIRAIEIAKQLGAVPPLKKVKPQFDVLKLGLTVPPLKLRQKIKKRLQIRLNSGLVREVRRLQQQGLSWRRLNELGLEYRYVARFLRDQLTYQKMVEKLETAIWHYAKRQTTWFKKDKEIKWVENYRSAERLVSGFL